MASLVQKYCIFIVWIFSLIFSISQVVTNSLICNEGYDVSFECPCPGELNECRFKKLFQGGYIVRNGILNAQLIKFEFNDKRTHITLKECHEEDEGTYIWMCGRCNVNKELHLEVQKVSEFHVKDSDVEEMLHCFVGGDISFECPCAEEFDSCGFKKLSQAGYIVRAGLLNSQHFKYELNERRTHITLKECEEDDEGTYVWMCGRCNVNRQYYLEVRSLEVQGLEPNQESTQIRVAHVLLYLLPPLFIPIAFFCLFCWVFVKYIRDFARTQR